MKTKEMQKNEGNAKKRRKFKKPVFHSLPGPFKDINYVERKTVREIVADNI